MFFAFDNNVSTTENIPKEIIIKKRFKIIRNVKSRCGNVAYFIEYNLLDNLLYDPSSPTFGYSVEFLLSSRILTCLLRYVIIHIAPFKYIFDFNFDFLCFSLKNV